LCLRALFPGLIESNDIYIDRVGRPADAPLIPDEPASHIVELRVEIDSVAFGSAQGGRTFSQSEFLLDHVKQAIHGIVLTGVGPDHQAIPSEAFNLTAADSHFKPAGLNAITRHLDCQPVKLWPMSHPLCFSLLEDIRSQRLQTRAGEECTDKSDSEECTFHSDDVTPKNPGAQRVRVR